jgi:hypothetical protein
MSVVGFLPNVSAAAALVDCFPNIIPGGVLIGGLGLTFDFLRGGTLNDL